ncbi:MAG: NifB/NifX family molybdenum-iron cluster-binding protein [Candidatus Zixiibacteriota bacterium]
MIVAIPILNKLVAPCFEAAKEFAIYKIEDNGTNKLKTAVCLSDEGFKRVRLLYLHDVNFLICNGIKGFFRDQLVAIGIKVIPNINDSIDKALERFLANELTVYENCPDGEENSYEIAHDDLIDWARELFESNGYKISNCPGDDTILIDLVGEIKCPLCGKKIKVAVCCGGHTYRAEQEIKEFYHLAKTEYNARVFVYPNLGEIVNKCEEYGINLICPDNINLTKPIKSRNMLPILTGPIEGHEKLMKLNERD